jgi:hypothetical protein
MERRRVAPAPRECATRTPVPVHVPSRGEPAGFERAARGAPSKSNQVARVPL